MNIVSVWTFFLRLAFLSAIALTVLPNGSINGTFYYLSALCLGILALMCCTLSLRSRRLVNVNAGAMAVCCILAAYIALQTLALPNNPFGNPVWDLVADLNEGTSLPTSSISVAPGQTFGSLPGLIMPFLAFVISLRLLGQEKDARSFWHWLSSFGLVLLILSLARHFYFTEASFFGTPARHASINSALTGNFYNQNAISAFAALVILAALGSFLLISTAAQKRTSRSEPHESTGLIRLSTPQILRFTLCLIAAILALMVIFLTKSRSGSLITLLVVGLTVLWVLTSSRVYKYQPGWAKIAIPALVILIAVALFWSFGSRTVTRFQVDGIENNRLCLLRSTWQAILDYPIWGTGWGTYRDVLPVYRDITCGLAPVFERAHNDYLEGWLGLGLPFFLIPGFVAWATFYIVRIGLKERRRYSFVPKIMVGIVAYLALHSLVDFPLQYPGLSVYAAALLGTAASIALARKS